VTENGKTGLFVGTAALLGLLAWVSTPKQISNKDEIEQVIGKSLFDFADPTEVASLKILKTDEELGTTKKFDLTRDSKSGAWVIPSHDSYPADAASQISKVANAFIDLKALTVASKSASDHKAFGVVEPDDTKSQVGETGLGTLVSMENQKGEVLVNLVIGKEVRDNPKQRYVRRTGSDAIFATEIDPSVLSTDFASWIEGDLLKLSSNDISGLSVQDYNIVVGPGGRGVIKKNFNADLNYSTTDNKWIAKKIETFEKTTPNERKLADDEELNTTKLTEIKNTLDSLKIADVARKPKGLAADLKADKDLLDDKSALESLNEKGFYPVPSPDGKSEIYSASGEMSVSLKDGVTYLLRFGEAFASLGGAKESGAEAESNSGTFYRTLFVTANLDESQYPMPELQAVPQTVEEMKALEEKERKQREADDAADKAAASPMPTEQPKPPADKIPSEEKPAKSEDKSQDKDTTPNALKAKKENKLEKAAREASEAKAEPAKDAPAADSPAKEPAAAEAKPAETPAPSDSPKPADTPKPESGDQSQLSMPRSVRLVSTQADGKEGKTEEPKSEAKEAVKSDETKSSEKTDTDKDSKTSEAKKDESKPDESKKEKSEKPSDDAEKSTKPDAEKPTATKDEKKLADAKADKKTDAETADELKEKLAAVQERITKDNTRLLDDRKDRMETARKKAAELNARFADWYYEISDSEYKRIRLTLDDLIKKKTPPAAPAGAPTAPQGFPGLPPQ
jgi:Domain of unknown function (DUF4340)